LSSTSFGSVTTETGEFTLSRFPDGRFDLVVSCIGYETYKVAVQSDNLPVNLQIILQPKVVELQEVVVEAYDKDGWYKWGNIFADNFMGTSAFASDCKLYNWQSLRFHFNKKLNTVTVTTDEQLIIENNALGYLLKYSLTRFEYDLTNRIFLLNDQQRISITEETVFILDRFFIRFHCKIITGKCTGHDQQAGLW
jgi:hypothetical protein